MSRPARPCGGCAVQLGSSAAAADRPPRARQSAGRPREDAGCGDCCRESALEKEGCDEKHGYFS
eukprot:8594168-Alexandrium_andersonii.AAC.1